EEEESQDEDQADPEGDGGQPHYDADGGPRGSDLRDLLDPTRLGRPGGLRLSAVRALDLRRGETGGGQARGGPHRGVVRARVAVVDVPRRGLGGGRAGGGTGAGAAVRHELAVLRRRG